ncbi:MAG: acetoacetate--CoA ligase [Candidatus Electryonea clarkiae]|nr:acetoacetate--CoA ligase [Candidatus Electryonea clarkiae]MDP8286740.1 acetoacetate--CoA ligase [Candidatus Electryonea clarkiae]
MNDVPLKKPLWRPSRERIEKANLTTFSRFLNNNFDLQFDSYADLHSWSVSDPGTFWRAVWQFTRIKASKEPTEIVKNFDSMEEVTWFPGSRLNFAENLLRFRDEKTALISVDENGRRTALTYANLYSQVARLSHAFRKYGIVPGDRIAGYLPNISETVVTMLAATSIGAAWSSTSPDFGARSVIDRFGQINPRILVTTDGYSYGGKQFDLLPNVKEIVTRIPSIEKTIIVSFGNEKPVLDEIENIAYWDDILEDNYQDEIQFEQLPFNHPLYIMYSSGTTGVPKSIVHGAGGTLLQHMKELILHTDLKRDDCIFYYTTCGWMMWNWLVSSLGVGASVVLYEGSPGWPRIDTLFRLIESEGITVFGTSAKFISTVEKSGLKPRKTVNLSSLRTILSTGSPLAPEMFEFVYEDVKHDVCLSSISGGTDIISCFALGNPTGPVWSGELQVRGLGMDVQVFDENKRPVTGIKGELVCTKPFPSMPVYFWNDTDRSKYHSAYFSRYENIWHHGDYAEITEHGGVIIHGRSDAILNPGGVRIGTAEIYRVVEAMDEVIEGVCVGQNWKDDVRVILFLVLQNGFMLDDELEVYIKAAIKEKTTPRHVPEIIKHVTDIPRTKNGKITEIAVKRILDGKPVMNLDALANPEALEQYKNFEELKIT